MDYHHAAFKFLMVIVLVRVLQSNRTKRISIDDDR